MASQFNLPEPLDFPNRNISENWKLFMQELRLYLITTEKLKKLSEVKTSILLNCIGKQGRQIYKNFEFSSVNYEMNYDITVVRYKFLTSRQDKAEKFDDFINELKTLSCDSVFRQPHQRHDYYRNKRPPPSENYLTLTFAIKACQTTEATSQQVELLEREPNDLNIPKSGKNNYQPVKKRPEETHSHRVSPFINREKIAECKFYSYYTFEATAPYATKSATPARNTTTSQKCASQTNTLRKSCRMTLTHQHI